MKADTTEAVLLRLRRKFRTWALETPPPVDNTFRQAWTSRNIGYADCAFAITDELRKLRATRKVK